jgi:uncharacterized protein (TIGR02466 family)
MDFSFPITPDISIAFATPLLVRTVPGYEKVNEALVEQVVAARDEDQGVRVSNRGGWHSSPTLWDWETPEIEALKGWVHDGMLRMAALSTQETNLRNVDLEYVAGAWANINEHGSYNDPHVHPDCDWSCVYYASSGEPEPGWERNGQFELRDPRVMAQSSKLGGYGFARSLLIDPEPGKMILFPAWMEHAVHPFYGAGERISIAANIKVIGGRHAGMEG